MEEHQTVSSATGCGGMGVADITLFDSVELSSFVATGDRLRVHLNGSCLGDTPTTTLKQIFLWLKSHHKWRERQKRSKT